MERGTRRIRHRGPDDEGYLLATRQGTVVSCGGEDTDPALRMPHIRSASLQPLRFDLALGFRRLAILDLSASGHQPMTSADGQLWIVFNGEIYNYRDLRSELQQAGRRFVTATDTEVVLAAYALWGPDCLRRLNGMWAFAIYDRRRHSLFLARDRFGIKPLYYTFDRDFFSFCSEIKGLQLPGSARASVREAAVVSYLRDGWLPEAASGLTFFEGIASLPPAHYLTVDLESSAISTGRYWTLPEPEPDAGGFLSRFRALLDDAVRLHLQADVAVGTCLSGGLDSSSIVTIVHEIRSDRVDSGHQKTVSAVFGPSFHLDESRYIQLVLEGKRIESVSVRPDAFRLSQELDDLIECQEEPFHSSSIYAQYCVMRAARAEGLKVMLDGQGADEVLGGYRPYEVHYRQLASRHAWRALAREATAGTRHASVPLLRTLVEALWPGLGTTLRRVRHGGRTDAIEQVVVPNGPAEGRPRAYGTFQNLAECQAYQLCVYPLPNLLRYEDRNAMAHGVEGRVPYLDIRLVEEVFRYGGGERIRHGWTKWPLRQAMTGRLPREVLWRSDKVGFETPETDWLKVLLRDRGFSWTPALRCSRYLDTGKIARLSTSASARLSSRFVWRVLNLETWLSRLDRILLLPGLDA